MLEGFLEGREATRLRKQQRPRSKGAWPGSANDVFYRRRRALFTCASV